MHCNESDPTIVNSVLLLSTPHHHHTQKKYCILRKIWNVSKCIIPLTVFFARPLQHNIISVSVLCSEPTAHTAEQHLTTILPPAPRHHHLHHHHSQLASTSPQSAYHNGTSIHRAPNLQLRVDRPVTPHRSRRHPLGIHLFP
jgi:hypothetical protein